MPASDPAGETDFWGLAVDVGPCVTPPDGPTLDRDAFLGWLWARFGNAGLGGISEGEVDAAEAAVRGLVASPRVIDAAAAPLDRDWLSGRDVAQMTCWFESEAAARDAAGVLAAAVGCMVGDVRRAPPAADDWRASFVPLDVSGFGTVRPAWDAGAAGTVAGRTTVFIEPGPGFGTGSHETTRLCLAAVAAWADADGRLARVLDVGSGSGILAIAAAVRGGGRADAVEIDPSVHEAIRANAARNGVAARLTVATEIPPMGGPYDLVVANIVAEVLLQLADGVCGAVRRDEAGAIAGCVILSGLLADDVPRVAAAYAARLGAVPLETRLGDWYCLRFAAGGYAGREGPPAGES